MSHFQRFIFSSYHFDESSKQAVFTYSLDDKIQFEERYTFDFTFADYDQAALDRALQNLFFMAGVSYYKMYLPPEIITKNGQLNTEDAKFFREVYQKGLGEFFYTNRLDPRTEIPFVANAEDETAVSVHGSSPHGQLVALGGGKDSLVSVEFLRDLPNVATWSLGHRQQLEPLVEKVGLPHMWVDRQLDKKIGELNQKDALNGHVPISAILACVGTVVAILSGRSDVVVSNEYSANEPNLTYQGIPINHQYSKSQDFEEQYQNLLKRHFDTTQHYYSFLRPLSDLHIAELFVKRGFLRKYQDVFSSCNRAFTQHSDRMFWCGECPKCAFTFLALSPFTEQKNLESIFGKNMFTDPQLEQTYRELLGIQGDKPLECVGEIKEAQSALKMAQETHPELKKYKISLPKDYDYRQLMPDSMPEDIRGFLLSEVS
jgi:hypothetical protein